MHSQTWFWSVERLWQEFGTGLPQPETIDRISDIRDFYLSNGESRTFDGFRLRESFATQRGMNPVFTDENGKGYRGLLHQEITFDSFGRAFYLVDNHHLALVAFAEIAAALGNSLPILHIDAHRDDAIFPNPVPKLDVANVAETVSLCRVSDYLDAAEKGEIVGPITRVTQSHEFEVAKIPDSGFILNLDLDIFGEEGSAVDLGLKLRVIRIACQRAASIVMATSPGFMDQDTAIRLVKIFCANS